ncbi:MAG TPA: hypothetical protein VE861_02180 [Gemmatimonadaceae bacterium]|nr:hypothetical protein [Gemmatimonadaceae bacterium]
MSMPFRRPAAAVAAMLVHAAAAHAQVPQVAPIGGSVRFVVAQPVGEFERYVKNGWGVGGDFRWFPADQQVVSLRADATYVNYGRRTTRECFGTGCRITIDINTSNNIFSGLVGPELQVPVGPIRPYVNALAGMTVLWTQSSADGADDGDDTFRTTNLRDNVFTSALGGGVRIPLGGTAKLDLNARRNFSGRARYLTRDSFGDGTVTSPTVRESEVEMWTFSIGLAIGR